MDNKYLKYPKINYILNLLKGDMNMKCERCNSDMCEGFTTLLVSNNEAEGCTQYKCPECGLETWKSETKGKNYTV